MRTYKISEARAKLLEILDYVTGEEDGIVLIEHRNEAGRAALLAEAHLKSLHRTIEELRARTGEPIRLEGTAEIPPSEE